MRPFLVLQLRPEDDVADNEYAAILRYGHLTPRETQRVRIGEAGIPLRDFSHYAGIIVGGSPFDISTPAAQKTATQKKVEADFSRLFDQVVTNDIPFLGACSGNGLLGSYCGTTISTKYGEPVGGVDITLTDEGMRDPLLQGLPRTFRALAAHKEACDEVPQGAVLLATSATCPVQMFRIGEQVYGTQFHPEGDAKGFTLGINTYKQNGYFLPEEATTLIEKVQKETTPHAHTLLRRFVGRHRHSALPV